MKSDKINRLHLDMTALGVRYDSWLAQSSLLNCRYTSAVPQKNRATGRDVLCGVNIFVFWRNNISLLAGEKATVRKNILAIPQFRPFRTNCAS